MATRLSFLGGETVKSVLAAVLKTRGFPSQPYDGFGFKLIIELKLNVSVVSCKSNSIYPAL